MRRVASASLMTIMAVLAMATPVSVSAKTVPAAFGACRAGHNVQKDGKNVLGPNLFGVAGRPAASMAGFTYSAALKASKLLSLIHI